MLERRALALLAFAAVPLFAQEPAEQDPNALLALALRKQQTAENLVASVEVKHEAPEGAVGGGFGGGAGMIVVQTKILGEEEPFEGRVEACRATDGTVVLLSEKELPGFAVFVGLGRTVERTTFEEARFSVEQLKGELAALLDPRAFAERIFAAKLEPKRDALTGETTFAGKVGKDIVPRTGGEMGFLVQGRVLEAHATLVLSADGGLKTAAVKITRSDPEREMMRGGGKRFVIGGPGAPAPADDDDKKHDIVGGSTTYTLSFREGGLSERAKAFKEEIERLVRAAPADGR